MQVAAIGQNLVLAIRRWWSLAMLAGPGLAPRIAIGLVRMHWRYFLVGRGRGLARALPLATPLKVHVDPASHCNFRCFFCPQSDPAALHDAGLEPGVMRMPLLRKLVDGFAAFPDPIGELVFGNYGEPLLNRNIAGMIAYAVGSGRAREVSLVTNAALLDAPMAAALVEAGLHKIRISIEALTDEGYRRTTASRTTFAEIVANVAGFYARARGRTFVYVKIIDTGLSAAEQRAFFRIFAPISDAASIENLIPATPEAARLVSDGQPGVTGVGGSSRRQVCPSPFYTLSVHVNGDVGVCCADWHHKTKVGSLDGASLSEIWHGKPLQRFRSDQLLKSWQQLPACAGCQTVAHFPGCEDLDGPRQRLVALYPPPGRPAES